VTTPFVYIQVGSGTISLPGLPAGGPGGVQEVVFNLPAGVQAGDGTSLIGTPVIPVAFLGYSGRNQANLLVTVDSSGGLTSGRGGRMPFSEFSWTTRDGDIPAGQFNGSANQLLVSYRGRGRRVRGIVDFLTFSYANNAVYPPGSYTGRVVYTVTSL
jgi:hypothetical protein